MRIRKNISLWSLQSSLHNMIQMNYGTKESGLLQETVLSTYHFSLLGRKPAEGWGDKVPGLPLHPSHLYPTIKGIVLFGAPSAPVSSMTLNIPVIP